LTQCNWGGGLLSNTPIRELLHHHRKYWMDYYDLKKENDDNNYDYLNSNNKIKRVPDLEIYVVDLYPAIEKDNIIPSYKDQILDRSNDIRFHDRTVNDIKSARMVSDYIDLTYKLIDFALNIRKDDNKDILNKLKNEIFNREVDQSHHRMGGLRKYKDLLIGRFDVQDVKYIERKDNSDTISGKHGDFSTNSIRQSIKKGIEDAKECLYPDL
jgi:hypothetical protein